MYRTQQTKELQQINSLLEEAKLLAQQHQDKARSILEKEHSRLESKAQKNLPKITKDVLSKIRKMAETGEYHLRYRYNPWYRFWDNFDLDNDHWNGFACSLLKVELENMGFRCEYDCKRLSISWN